MVLGILASLGMVALGLAVTSSVLAFFVHRGAVSATVAVRNGRWRRAILVGGLVCIANIVALLVQNLLVPGVRSAQGLDRLLAVVVIVLATGITTAHFADQAQALALPLRRDLITRQDGGYRFQVELIRRWFADSKD